MITIHFNEDDSLYEQIYRSFIQEIQLGHLAYPDQLPSRRALAQHLGVSLNTVKMAYEQLLDEGYIVSKERSGFFVDKLSPDYFPEPAIPEEVEVIAEEEPPHYDFSYDTLDYQRFSAHLLSKCASEGIKRSLHEKKIGNKGLLALRLEIKKYLRDRRGVNACLDQILITGGYVENMMLLMTLCPQGVFAVEDPGYKKNHRLFTGVGRQLIYIPLDQYGFSVADLEKSSANLVITTPNHQFPTGLIMGARRRHRLLDWAAQDPQRYIVEDDYDSDFKYTGKPIPALKSLDSKDQVILSGSFSQSIGPFLGISYLVLPRSLMASFDQQDIPLSGASLFQQHTLAQFMETGAFEKHLNRMNAHYRKKRSYFLKILKDQEGLSVLGADVGLHFLLRVDPKKRDITCWQEWCGKKGIRLESLSVYAKKTWPYEDFLIGFGGIAYEEMDQALEALLKCFPLRKRKEGSDGKR